MGHETLGDEQIRILARVAGIDPPDEDVPKLTQAFNQHLAAIDALPVVEVTEVEPPLVFRVIWDE